MLNFALFSGLAYFSLLWISQIFSAATLSVPPYTPPKPDTAGMQMQTQADYSILTRKNLFNPGARFSPMATGEIVPCTLPLRLVGTIITENKKNNIAIIENINDKQQDLYHINDQIAGSAVIAQVSRFEVILNNNGRLERLAIDFGEGALEAMLSSPSPATGRPAGAQVAMLNEGQYLMDRRFFESQKANMNDMMTQIRAIPNMAPDGSINGFQLFEIVKDSMYDRIGLKNQDVLQRVNGQPLNSVETGLDLFNALKNDNHFVLDVVRNKERKTIKIDIQ
ncbi:MAG: hypothetical protein HZA04_08810 [Nitrospinae bacterium]|nr:hypothetical protein [Nitrospinota bacterium]